MPALRHDFCAAYTPQLTTDCTLSDTQHPHAALRHLRQLASTLALYGLLASSGSGRRIPLTSYSGRSCVCLVDMFLLPAAEGSRAILCRCVQANYPPAAAIGRLLPKGCSPGRPDQASRGCLHLSVRRGGHLPVLWRHWWVHQHIFFTVLVWLVTFRASRLPVQNTSCCRNGRGLDYACMHLFWHYALLPTHCSAQRALPATRHAACKRYHDSWSTAAGD